MIPPGDPSAGSATPLHPLLPAADQGHAPPAGGHDESHAASAGPQRGARGAIWFAAVVGLITLAALVALVVVLLSGDVELPDMSLGDDGRDHRIVLR